MKTSQKDKVKEMLQQGWICSSQFLEAYISEYRSRCNDLRKDGYMVETRSCQNPNHWHNNKAMQEWRIAGHKTEIMKPVISISAQEFLNKFPSKQKQLKPSGALF